MNPLTPHRHHHAHTRATMSLAVVALSAAPLMGCSSQQAYSAGQAWQRQECFKISDAQDRSRCLASASTSYEDYKRQAEAAKAGQ